MGTYSNIKKTTYDTSPEAAELYKDRRWTLKSIDMRQKHPYCYSCYHFYSNITVDNLEVDHIIPFMKGGAKFDSRNLRVLCHRCHTIKGSNTPVGQKLLKGGYKEEYVTNGNPFVNKVKNMFSNNLI